MALLLLLLSWLGILCADPATSVLLLLLPLLLATACGVWQFGVAALQCEASR